MRHPVNKKGTHPGEWLPYKAVALCSRGLRPFRYVRVGREIAVGKHRRAARAVGFPSAHITGTQPVALCFLLKHTQDVSITIQIRL